MKKGNQYKIWFFEFLNDGINHVQFEKWPHETKELEFEIPSDHYMDLISFDFKSYDS